MITSSFPYQLQFANSQMKAKLVHIPSLISEGTSSTCTSAGGACCIPEQSKKVTFLADCIHFTRGMQCNVGQTSGSCMVH